MKIWPSWRVSRQRAFDSWLSTASSSPTPEFFSLCAICSLVPFSLIHPHMAWFPAMPGQETSDRQPFATPFSTKAMIVCQAPLFSLLIPYTIPVCFCILVNTFIVHVCFEWSNRHGVLLSIITKLSKLFQMNCYKDVKGTIYDYETLSLNGKERVQFKQYAGKHVLFVNVATYCGLTIQYPGKNSEPYDLVTKIFSCLYSQLPWEFCSSSMCHGNSLPSLMS